MREWQKKLQTGTEAFLTWRKRRKFIKKEKQKQKNAVVEWVEAFLWAVLVVLLINQYFFQAYQIPSGSMKNTLLISDRIFVNKMIYGPEIYPGGGKLPGFKEPERGEVIIFESPTYISKGPAFDILQRIIYMVTLSFVDIDKDPEGNPKPHFLIKRGIGIGRDRLRFVRGEVEFLLPGSKEWVRERELDRHGVVDYTVRRLVEPEEYSAIRADAEIDAYESALLPVQESLRGAAPEGNVRFQDLYAWNKYRAGTLYSIYPNEGRYGSEWRKAEIGWYLPENWVFPLGDNRDNSRDARYFGPVEEEKVLGRAMFIYWPFYRIGGIR
jgi:signal peptidase I